MKDNPPDLKEGEFHPAAHIAMEFIKDWLKKNDVFLIKEALASCALSGDRLAALASETLRRLLDNEPVSDRYLMGLAWTFHSIEERDKVIKEVNQTTNRRFPAQLIPDDGC